jgi:hypothetical protein
MGRVRGASILGTLTYLRRAYGDDAPSRALESLPPALFHSIGGGAALVESGWYECQVLSQMTRAADRLWGAGDLQLAREIGRQQAFSDVNRFFKWLLRLAGPAAIFGRASSVWRNYYDVGTSVAEQVGEGRAALRIDDWDCADEVVCRRVEGWMERALELTIGSQRSPRIREVQHLDYDPAVTPHRFCRFVAEWRQQ